MGCREARAPIGEHHYLLAHSFMLRPDLEPCELRVQIAPLPLPADSPIEYDQTPICSPHQSLDLRSLHHPCFASHPGRLDHALFNPCAHGEWVQSQLVGRTADLQQFRLFCLHKHENHSQVFVGSITYFRFPAPGSNPIAGTEGQQPSCETPARIADGHLAPQSQPRQQLRQPTRTPRRAALSQGWLSCGSRPGMCSVVMSAPSRLCA